MARRGPAPPELVLTDIERRTLEGWVLRRSTAQALALRSRIVLACAEGVSNMEVVRRLGVSPPTVNQWRRRFVEHRLGGLSVEPRPGATRKDHRCPGRARRGDDTRTSPARQRLALVDPIDGTGPGMSQTAIPRIRRAFELKPHLVQTWKLSADPLFIDKVRT